MEKCDKLPLFYNSLQLGWRRQTAVPGTFILSSGRRNNRYSHNNLVGQGDSRVFILLCRI